MLHIKLTFSFSYFVHYFSDVVQVAKEYFDAIVKIGELASETKGARQLGNNSQLLFMCSITYIHVPYPCPGHSYEVCMSPMLILRASKS